MVAIPVLANDSATSGGSLVLGGKISPEPTAGTAYVDGDSLRYAAPKAQSVDSFGYSVTDSNDATKPAAGQVSVRVLAADAPNHAPRPVTVSARVVRGSHVNIPIPLEGIDPEGDQVVVRDVQASDDFHNTPTYDPVQHQVVYTASNAKTGTDRLVYRVCDVQPVPACADGTIQVAVFTRQSNDPPTTVGDTLVMRPSRTVSFDVLSNDSDPDGDAFHFVAAEAGDVPDGFSVHPDGTKTLSVTAPKTEGTYSLIYRVADGTRPTNVPGSLTVVVDKTARLQAPIARDDVVPDSALIGHPTSVAVDVLANDTDPDGGLGQLTVRALPGSEGVSVTPDQKRVVVTLGTTWRSVPYQVVDSDGNVGTASIAVPPAGNAPPQQAKAVTREIAAGQQITLQVTDFATDPDNGPDPLTFLRADLPSANAGHAEKMSPTSLTYTAPKDNPPASDTITAAVTDGADSRRVNVVITITAPNRPPTFFPPTLTVEEGAVPAPVQLTTEGRVTDPDPQDAGTPVSFGPSSFNQNGVSGTISAAGEVQAQTTTAKVGTEFQVPITVADVHGAATKTYFVVRVVATTRGPLVAAALTQPHLDQGASVDVDIVGQNHDPFQGVPGRAGLKPVASGIRVVSGDASATLSGNVVRVTAGQNATPGLVVVAYRISDAVNRTADGIIKVPLWGVPGAPSQPRVVTTTGSTVTLAWTPGASNISSANPDDAAVTYEISAPGLTAPITGISQPQTRIEGLVSGQSYTFSVVARNSVGVSPAATAEPVVPDALPPAPVVRVLTDPTTFDKDHVTIEWDQPAPPDGASAISSYNIDYGSGTTGTVSMTDGVAYGTTGKQLTLPSLTMGQTYSIRLCPVNKATVAQGTTVCSDPAAQGTPIGIPDPPASVTADGLSNPADGGVIVATWPAVTGPGMGGDASVTYECTLMDAGGAAVAGAAVQTVTQPTCTLLGKTGVTYKVRVITRNAKGPSTGTLSPAEPIRKAPTAVTNLQVTPKGTDRAIAINFGAPTDDGCSCAELYEWSLDGVGWSPLGGSGSVVPVPQNGVAYTVHVRANNAITGTGSGLAGADSFVGGVIAFAPPSLPAIGWGNPSGHQIAWNWSVTANGRPISVSFWVDGGGANGAPSPGTVTGTANGSYTGTFAAGTPHTLFVKSCDDAGNCLTNSATGTTPPSTISVFHGPSGGCTGCYYIDFSLNNFNPNTTYTVGLSNAQGNWLPSTSSATVNVVVTTDGNGNVTKQSVWFYGYPNGWVRATTAGITGTANPWGS
jgi:hypothetical protein